MKKIAGGVLLLFFIFAVEVTYINYRLHQNLDAIELNQQNILTKIYSLERKIMQIGQTVRQAMQQIPKKQQLNPEDKNRLLLTTIDIQNIKMDKQEPEEIN